MTVRKPCTKMLGLYYLKGRGRTLCITILCASLMCIMFVYLILCLCSWQNVRRSSISLPINYHREINENQYSHRKQDTQIFKKPYAVIDHQLNRDEPSSHKRILLWTPFFHTEHWIKTEHFKDCPIQNCSITEDKSLIGESEALIMHERDLAGRSSLPPLTNKSLDQKWIWFSQESHLYFETNISEYGDVFNWTMTYRLDSDVPVPYGAFRKRPKTLLRAELEDELKPLRQFRKRLVAIRISHCHSHHSERLAYARKLNQFVPVDILGACGTPCKELNNCDDSYMRQYKFYLAFENCHCKDYITEKFWLPLGVWGNVPIVMGGSDMENYETVAPPNSYIHVDLFETPKQLAEYLILLDKSPRLYEEYFQWRRQYVCHVNWHCDLCAAVHDVSRPIKWYTDIKAWYVQDRCPSAHVRYVRSVVRPHISNCNTHLILLMGTVSAVVHPFWTYE